YTWAWAAAPVEIDYRIRADYVGRCERDYVIVRASKSCAGRAFGWRQERLRNDLFGSRRTAPSQLRYRATNALEVVHLNAVSLTCRKRQNYGIAYDREVSARNRHPRR